MLQYRHGMTLDCRVWLRIAGYDLGLQARTNENLNRNIFKSLSRIGTTWVPELTSPQDYQEKPYQSVDAQKTGIWGPFFFRMYKTYNSLLPPPQKSLSLSCSCSTDPLFPSLETLSNTKWILRLEKLQQWFTKFILGYYYSDYKSRLIKQDLLLLMYWSELSDILF